MYIHIITGMKSGGAEKSVLRIVEHATITNDRHMVINLGKPTVLSMEVEKVGSIINLNIKNRFLSSIRKMITLYYSVKSEKNNIIVGWMYYGAVLALIFGRLNKYKVICNIRHTPISINNESLKIKLSLCLLRFLLSSKDKVVYNSKASMNWHLDYGFPFKNTTVAHNGFSRVESGNVLKEIEKKIKMDEIVIGVAARNHEMKNFHQIFQIFQMLQKAQNKIKFIVCGRDTNSLEIPAELHSKVSILGELSNMGKFYNRCHFSILFSKFGESFPNVLCESMIWGVPAFSSNIGDVKEIVDENFITDIGDVTGMFNLINNSCIQYFYDRNKYFEMCLDINKKINNNFGIEKTYNVMFGENIL